MGGVGKCMKRGMIKALFGCDGSVLLGDLFSLLKLSFVCNNGTEPSKPNRD